ncbi:DUF3291 domain-containing protein [Streptomyces afghaniensis]|uniref:DUF3291 domain-containing protein n=1 Tax=Streptomyces afghaniensis TaxID=66865 RepID=UPI00278913E1|nr:DUF3291 domain-containing protein [Streptomyces afghaniensis]MDQ1017063.1 hypothetical protein [Streptomyces afghaniensis]
MPTLPWTVPHTPPHGTEVHVFASRFETRTLWGALRFLAGTPAVWRQVRRSPGVYGATLKAKPLKRTFWTLSAWESKAALQDFVRAGAHGPAARGLAPRMKDASFTTWQASSDDLPLSWPEAMRRLP